MPDQFTEVTTKSWGSRLGNSFGAILGSLLIFIGSFVLLYWNEGRVDMSNIAKTAVVASADHVDPALDGKLISVTGQVKTSEMIGDKLFLAPGNYLGVMRTVEMYAWQENTSATSDVKVGGSEETKTTYSYKKDWVTNPANSSSFKVPEGHANPSMPYEAETVQASQASIGAYSLTPDKMELPGFTALTLTKEMVPTLVTPTATGAVMGSGEVMTGAVMEEDTTAPRLIDNAIYLGKGNATSPQIGDVRITYKVLRPDLRGTVFGSQSGSSIDTYSKDNMHLYSLYAGNRDEAITAMHDSYVMISWVLRLVGFLMMWGGLSGVFAPINVLLDVLPFLGSLSRGAISFITFFVALVLTILTVLISMILHNIFLVLLVAVLGFVAAFLWLKNKGKKVATA